MQGFLTKEWQQREQWQSKALLALILALSACNQGHPS